MKYLRTKIFCLLLSVFCGLSCSEQQPEEEKYNIPFFSFSVLGDSISTLDGYIPNGYPSYYPNYYNLRFEETWWGLLIEKYGSELISNSSWSGSSITANGLKDSWFHSDSRIKSLSKDGTSPEIIFVFGGTNDWGNNVMLDNDKEDYDSYSFSGAYHYMIKKIKEEYSESQIICLSILPRLRPSKSTDIQNTAGWTIRDANLIIEKICRQEGLIFIDLSSAFTGSDLTIDGLHPNKKGMYMIFHEVSKSLESLFNAIGN